MGYEIGICTPFLNSQLRVNLTQLNFALVHQKKGLRMLRYAISNKHFLKKRFEHVISNGLKNVVGIAQVDHGREANQSDVALSQAWGN
jgi:hypothetical protein